MSWLELSVTVDQEAAESVAELLARYGYNGGVVADQPFTPGDEGPEFEYDTARPVTLRTYIPLDAAAEETRSRVEHALWHLGQMRPVGALKVQQLEEEDWANAWKQHYNTQRVGERTVIVPSWLDYEAAPDEIVLNLDPGMAFGTGLHPTTQLCLRLLEQHARPGQRTLDLGTGSGILAIAAAKLGAGPVIALDNDPIAVEAASANVVRNGVEGNGAGQVQVALGSLGAGQRMGHWLSGDFGEPVGSHQSAVGSEQEPVGSRQEAVGSELQEGKRQSVVGSEQEPVGSQQSAEDEGETRDDKPGTANSKLKTQNSTLAFDLIVANLIAKVLIIVADDLRAALAQGGTLITSGIIIDREDEVALTLAAAGLCPLARYVEGEWVALVHTIA